MKIGPVVEFTPRDARWKNIQVLGLVGRSCSPRLPIYHFILLFFFPHPGKSNSWGVSFLFLVLRQAGAPKRAASLVKKFLGQKSQSDQILLSIPG